MFGLRIMKMIQKCLKRGIYRCFNRMLRNVAFLSMLCFAASIICVLVDKISGSIDKSRITVMDNAIQLTFANKMDLHKNHVVSGLDCSRLFANDSEEIARAHRLENLRSDSLENNPLQRFYPELDDATNCKGFKDRKGYIMDSLTKEEDEFPLAYSLLIFKESRQVEFLLRAIYRPQNYYCIHVDLKSDDAFKEDMKALVNCFENVFLSSESFNVSWGGVSILRPEIACLRDLLKLKKWKYFINLTGQEFPLKTNYELVKILRAVDGSNFVGNAGYSPVWEQWKAKAGPLPHGLQAFKGSVHITINRDFVDFIVHSEIANEVFNWSRRIPHAGEFFFNTLNHNPELGIPGSYNNRRFAVNSPMKPLLTRVKLWADKTKCEKSRHLVCILGVDSLPMLGTAHEFFANKFYYDSISFYTTQCLNELIRNRTRDEYLGKVKFSTEYYTNLWQYKYRLIK